MLLWDTELLMKQCHPHSFFSLFSRACIEIIQTLGLMFRETEIESSRLNTLAAKK
jgi:hypothetical protein